jgi:hypothetical protein
MQHALFEKLETHTRFLLIKLEEKDRLEDLGACEEIILKRMLEKCEVNTWQHLDV